MMGEELRDRLRRLPLFSHLKPHQLAWLDAHGEVETVAKDRFVFRQGMPADYFYVILSGEVQLIQEIDGQPLVLGTYKPGGFMGEVAVLSASDYAASARALADSDLFRLDNTAFREMFAICPELVSKLFSALNARLQASERFARQQEKMASLGVMAAGLAHELNNPAAAAGRASKALRDLMQDQRWLNAAVARLTDDAGFAALDRLVAQTAERAKSVQGIDALARADRESELDDWLYDAGLDDLVELAPALTSAGITASDLDDLRDTLSEEALPVALRWLNAALNAGDLLSEVEQSARRISDLVKAVKAYSYADQAPTAQAVDVHEGIEDTLTIMAYKLRKHNIAVVRDFDRALPPVETFGGELAQVWTNIIDNAIDAMGERGTLTIRTRGEGDQAICVEIADTGPGIPTEVQPRIFETFFTTKAVGKGTGLGLDIAYRIVASRHGGTIDVQSQPGDTRFLVCLPLKR